jgi:hypothetical protein
MWYARSWASVTPSRSAAFESLMEALNRMVLPFLKSIKRSEMKIDSPLFLVRYRHDKRLLRRSGTCKTLENSTALADFPLTTGENTTEPTPAE